MRKKKITCILQIDQDFREIFYTMPTPASHPTSFQVVRCVFSSGQNIGEVLHSKPLTAKMRKNNETGRALSIIMC